MHMDAFFGMIPGVESPRQKTQRVVISKGRFEVNSAATALILFGTLKIQSHIYI
jgi:hypothetical protein